MKVGWCWRYPFFQVSLALIISSGFCCSVMWLFVTPLGWALVSFSWGQTLLRTEYSGVSDWFLSLSSAKSTRGFSSDNHCEIYLIELLEARVWRLPDAWVVLEFLTLRLVLSVSSAIRQLNSDFPTRALFMEFSRQEHRTLKDELPRSVGAHLLLEVSGEITPERMKRQSQSRNSTQLWMWLVTEVKSKRAILHRNLKR